MKLLKDKWMKDFITEVSKLTPEEFIGVLTVCDIKTYTIDGEVDLKNEEDVRKRASIKEFDMLLEELFDKVEGLNRIRRRNLMTIIKSANKGR